MRTSFLSILLLPLALAVPQDYVNTAIARTIELGGATTQLTTQYNVKAVSDSPGDYLLALAGEGDEEPSWWEVSVGGKIVNGLVSVAGRVPAVSVPLGSVKKGDSVTLSLSMVTTHSSKPLPASIAQTDPQYLFWETNSTYVDSYYSTDVERIKIRTPTPNILSHGTVGNTYARDNTVTKSASTVTLGPFHSLPPTLDSDLKQQPFSVHYETREPVMVMRTFKRSAEVSHWGGNINIQDEVELVNMGPILKGHFSRLAHQQSKFHASTPAQILSDITFKLPPTAHSVYYYDVIGNVSTSHFRPGSTPASINKNSKVRTSPRTVDGVLELRPRYPILGGWNYTYTTGWDMSLGDALKVKDGKNILAVPFLINFGSVIDDAELTVVLPEGARDIEIHTPFPVDSITHSIHKTYLDTSGRPKIIIKKKGCTENHAQAIYVTYNYPLSALLQKPLTVASVVGGMFLLAMGLRRVDYSIDKK